jgi:hypothetical protein
LQQVKDFNNDYTLVTSDEEIRSILSDNKSDNMNQENSYKFLFVKVGEGEYEEIYGTDDINCDSWCDLVFKLCPRCGGELVFHRDSETDSYGREQSYEFLLCNQLDCGYSEE